VEELEKVVPQELLPQHLVAVAARRWVLYELDKGFLHQAGNNYYHNDNHRGRGETYHSLQAGYRPKLFEAFQ